MRIATKLAAGLIGMTTLMLALGSISLAVNDYLMRNVEEITQRRYPIARKISEVRETVLLQGQALRNSAILVEPREIRAERAAAQNFGVLLQSQLSDLFNLPMTSAEKKLLDEVKASHETYIGAVGRFAALVAKGRDSDAVDLLVAEVRPAQEQYFKTLEIQLLEQSKVTEARAAEALDVSSGSRLLLIAVIVFATLTATAVGWRLCRGISGGIASALASAKRIGEGDLSQRLDANRSDEIGQLIHALALMQERLAQLVTRVRQGSESVAVGSAEIAQGNQNLSDRTEAQASALQQTAASMEQLSATVAQNADNARQASLLARDTSTVAAQGGEVVARVVSTMKGIHDSSGRIADIIGVIDGIAFQTNILALNAAVEAARAGEQGRGFAVVASEVRALAGRSANAAREIKDLISASVQQVEQGSSLVDQAGETMQDVVASIRKLNDIVGEISAASAEQSAGVKEVSEAVTSMDQTTQQNAALVEEMTAAASSLKSQADDLVDAVAVFKIGAQVNHATKAPTTRVSKLSASKPSQSRIPVSQIATKTRPDDRSVRSSHSEKMVVSRSNISVADDGWESY